MSVPSRELAKKKDYGQPNLLPLERYSLNLFPQRDVPFFKGEANMKLSLPNNSLLALASVLILPAPAVFLSQMRCLLPPSPHSGQAPRT